MYAMMYMNHRVGIKTMSTLRTSFFSAGVSGT